MLTFPSHQRRLEMIPGLMTWGTIILPVLLSFFIPEVIAIFLILYTALWFLRSIEFSYFLIRTYFISRWYLIIHWRKALTYIPHPELLQKEIESEKNKKIRNWLVSIKESIDIHTQKGTLLMPEDVIHFIIVATYKEEIGILRETMERLALSDYDLQKVFILLAGEQRDEKRALENGDILKKEFGALFGDFYVSIHPDNLPGEVKGKGPNITYGAKMIIPKFLQEHPVDPDHVLVTTLDADHCAHPSYLANLTLHYVLAENRGKKSYQPLPLLYNNIWDVPMLNRVVAFGSSFWHMIESGRPDRLRNFASHAQPLDALMLMDYWSTTTIVEDGHQFWRSYFALKGDYSVIPLFIPIYQDAVQSETYTKTLVDQYKQLRRWAWGCSDIPFVLQKMKEQKQYIPFAQRFSQLYRLIEGHYMWATAPIIVTLTVPIPRMLNEHFAKTVMSYNMGITLSTFFSYAMFGVFIAIWVSILMAPRIPHTGIKKRLWLRISSVVQWFLLPLSTLIFGALPAIDSQTRLLFGKHFFVFNVTEKIRSQKNEK